MYNKIISTLTAIRNNITAIICVWEIETKVYSDKCNAVFVVASPFFGSFSRFLNNEACNLFMSMINYIFENLPVPVKHFCDPGLAK